MHRLYVNTTRLSGASQVALVVKNPSANAGDVRDPRSIPGLPRNPGEGSGNPPSILAWRNLWTEEPEELQSTGSQRVRFDRSDLARAHTHTHTHTLRVNLLSVNS